MKLQHLALIAILAGIFTVGCASDSSSGPLDSAKEAVSNTVDSAKGDAKDKAKDEAQDAAGEAKGKAMEMGGKAMSK
jgi:hypothetical protein